MYDPDDKFDPAKIGRSKKMQHTESQRPSLPWRKKIPAITGFLIAALIGLLKPIPFNQLIEGVSTFWWIVGHFCVGFLLSVSTEFLFQTIYDLFHRDWKELIRDGGLIILTVLASIFILSLMYQGTTASIQTWLFGP